MFAFKSVVEEWNVINIVSANQETLLSRVSLWFNYNVMHKWLKPTLFGVGLVAAVLIATNPSFVLPYKYHFIEEQPAITAVEPVAELGEVTALPDESMIIPEAETTNSSDPSLDEIVTTSNSGQVAAAAVKTESKVKVSGTLSIPSLKISAPVVYVTERSEKVFQLGLQQGVVQYPGTALPGQLGNMYIFGHSSDYRWSKGSYKTVFAKLPNIKIGSEIIITDGSGKAYKYKAISTVIALPTETKYLSQYKYERRLLTVQTSYPVGTALKRFLVQAELVEK